MASRIQVALLALVLFTMTQTPADTPMRFSIQDSGKTVETCVGEELELVLEGNPTTGYAWDVVTFDSNILKQGKSDFWPGSGLIGAGGNEVIRFQAVAAGETVVKLVHHRPFDKKEPPLRTFELTVRVKQPCMPDR